MGQSSKPAPAALEIEVRRLLDANDRPAAAAKIVRELGPELLGYLHAVAPTAVDAEEVFSAYCERLMRGLAGFRGDSSLRTWSYRIARNLLIDDARARQRGRVLQPATAELANVAAQVREQTATYLRTETKTHLAELRARLPETDRTMLVLRVDRQLSWKEVAEIMLEQPDPAAVARLRKRFTRLVARLRSELQPDGRG